MGECKEEMQVNKKKKKSPKGASKVIKALNILRNISEDDLDAADSLTLAEHYTEAYEKIKHLVEVKSEDLETEKGQESENGEKLGYLSAMQTLNELILEFIPKYNKVGGNDFNEDFERAIEETEDDSEKDTTD